MEFRLPELGEGVTEGELVKWRIKPGDQIKDDQALCEIMTDKATIEIPSPFAGTIKELHAKEGEIVKVHQLMVSADAVGGVVLKTHTDAPKVDTTKVEMAQIAAPKASAQGPAPAQVDVLASPHTRKVAYEKGINLATIQGSGPHGRVLLEDLEGGQSIPSRSNAATGSARSAPVAIPSTLEERIPIRGMRKKISEKMHLSKSTAAHFTYVEEADATELVALRNQAKIIAEKKGIKLTYLPFILKAMVAALRKHPRLNSIVDDASQEIITKHFYNISISVQTDDGLTVPVIKNVEQKNVFQLAKEIADIVDRARKKKLTMEDFQGSTITLTNAGSIGGLFATPIINYPEVAILGFNKIARKPVVKVIGGREKIVVRDWTYFSISLDHRIIDGADAAEFMKTFISYIEAPALLFMEDSTYGV